jgi:WD40 repeat protein
MTAAWQTVRVFISSTFRDMHAERDQLVKVVFPALRESLLKDRIYLDDIDLRWGVTKEQAENDRVLDLCLKQIDSCRPFFIGILGERYGWVPLKLPADACKSFAWIQDHPGKSVTELEILHGVLNDPAMTERAFFYLRDPAFIVNVPAERKQVFLEGPTEQEFRDLSPDAAAACAAERRRKLHELKEKLRALQPGLFVFDNYPCRWDSARLDPEAKQPGRLVGLEAFGESMRQKLEWAIRTDPKLQAHFATLTASLGDPFGLADEHDYHKRFMEARLRVYVGREQINDALLAFADGNDLVPCLVTGPSGSGKSAALAQFVRDYQQKQPQTLVIPHFIGASPRSTNLRDMLRRFCQILKARFGFADDVPEEVAKLSVTFREFVGKVPADARVLLVIDALNQLDEADRAQELYWLPTALPPHVKVIVSCISDTLGPGGRGQGEGAPVLEAFRWRKDRPLELAALNDAEQREIIRQVPSLSAKTLDDDQVRLLLSSPATANPLFLLVALEELRGFAPYERLNERIVAFPREGDTVTAIFTQVIERLAEEFNQKLVETVLTLLASARRGLSERELQELVAGLDAADDLFPVLRQLRPYLLSRAGLIDYYHRNLFKAVRERYLPSEEQQRQAHVCLAEYFNAQDYWLESLEEQQRRAKTLPPTRRPANVRKVDELPWQLLQAADWQRSDQLLTDLAFLEAKAEAGLVFDLAADFSSAIGGMQADRPLLRILRLLEEALRRDIHFIARHPTTLFQCMWNLCWWYDCPEAASHYDDPKVDWGAQSPWEMAGPKLHKTLQQWRHKKQEATPEFLWIRSLRPPPDHLAGRLRAVLPHANAVMGVAISPDGQRIASVSNNHIYVWDTINCTLRYCLRAETGGVESVEFSPDGEHIVSCGGETVRVWNVRSGLCISEHTAVRVLSCSFGFIHVWDVIAGRQRLALSPDQGDFDTLKNASFSPDGTRIVIAAESQGLHILDANSGRTLLSLHGHSDKVYDAAFSPDGSRIVSSSRDHSVRLWDAQSGEQIRCLGMHGNRVYNVAFSADGRHVVSGSLDNTVRVFDTENKEPPLLLRGHVDPIHRAGFSTDGDTVVSASSDKTVRIWNVSSAFRDRPLRGHHRHSIRRVVCSQDGESLFSISSSDPGPFTGNKSADNLNSWDPDCGTPVLLGDESPRIATILQRVISKTLHEEGAQRAARQVTVSLINEDEPIEQLKRSKERWTAIFLEDVTAIVDMKIPSVACLFPTRIATICARPGDCLWAGAENVEANTPYGGFDDWRSRYLYILRMEGHKSDATAWQPSQRVDSHQDVQLLRTIEQAAVRIAALMQECQFNNARNVVSGIPDVAVEFSEVKSILLEEIGRAEMHHVGPMIDDAFKRTSELVKEREFHQARRILSGLPDSSNVVVETKRKLLEQLAEVEAECERIDSAVKKASSLVQECDFHQARRLVSNLPGQSDAVVRIKRQLLDQITEAEAECERIRSETASLQGLLERVGISRDAIHALARANDLNSHNPFHLHAICKAILDQTGRKSAEVVAPADAHAWRKWWKFWEWWR